VLASAFAAVYRRVARTDRALRARAERVARVAQVVVQQDVRLLLQGCYPIMRLPRRGLIADVFVVATPPPIVAAFYVGNVVPGLSVTAWTPCTLMHNKCSQGVLIVVEMCAQGHAHFCIWSKH
tara:strand:- start:256 stop:624 length:369 start_codon:yes stop_codon:yes gene_type:complete